MKKWFWYQIHGGGACWARTDTLVRVEELTDVSVLLVFADRSHETTTYDFMGFQVNVLGAPLTEGEDIPEAA